MKHILLKILGLFVGGWCMVCATSCEDPYQDETFLVYDVMPISAYLDSEPELYSEWVQVLKQADLYNALNIATSSYTLFAPTNAAVRQFYENKRVSSAAELDSVLGHEYLRQLVLYHILTDSISVDEFVQGGQLSKPTYTGDYLEVRYGSEGHSGFDAFYVNGEAHVGEWAISVVNGVIYTLDDVLRPMIDPMVSQLHELGRNDIMCEALNVTGWADVLANHETLLADGRTLTNYYTLLAVPDEVFNDNGIGTWQELAAKLGAAEDYTNPENALNRYMAYHIMDGVRSKETLCLFDVPLGDSTQLVHARLWDTKADMPIKVTMSPDGVFTMNEEAGVSGRAWIEDATADYKVRNGLIHQLTAMLPVPTSLQPERLCYDVTDCGLVRSYVERYSANGQVFQSSVKNVSTSVPVGLGYKYTYGPQGTAANSPAVYCTAGTSASAYRALNHDYLQFNLGYMGEATFETPVLLPGRYRIVMSYIYSPDQANFRTYKNGSNGGLTTVQLDNQPEKASKLIYSSISETELNTFFFELEVASEVEFLEAGRHTLKVQFADPAASNSNKYYILLDHFRFIPLIGGEESLN